MVNFTVSAAQYCDDAGSRPSESIDTHWDDIADNYERIYVQSGGSK